jgi:hypothetical protein
LYEQPDSVSAVIMTTTTAAITCTFRIVPAPPPEPGQLNPNAVPEEWN